MLKHRPEPNVDHVVEITFNVDKIAADGTFSFEDVYNTVLNVYLKNRLGYYITNDDRLVIHENGRAADGANMLFISNDLYENRWFRDYVKSMLFYNFNKDYYEDIIETIREYNNEIGKVYEEDQQ